MNMALKKGSFRMMHRNQWRLCRANKIRRETLLVLLAIETGPWGAGHYTGLFHLTTDDISEFTGLTEDEVDRAIDELERRGVIVYDRRKQVIFVRGMLDRQSPNFASSDNNLLGVANHVERMPEGSRAVCDFINAQRNAPELYELLEGYIGGDSEGDSEGDFEGTPKGTSKGTSNRPEDLETLRPEDLDTGNKETVIPLKDAGMTPRIPPSSTQMKYKPGKSNPKASGKGKPGNGNGLSSAQMKRKGLRIAAKKHASGEWDIFKVSDFLRKDYGFTPEDINSPEVNAALLKSSVEKQAAN